MKYYFTSEKFGYALRDANNAPWCLVTKNKEGWFAGMLLPSFPSNGPHRTAVSAGLQAVMMCKAHGVMPAHAVVGPIPVSRKKSRPVTDLCFASPAEQA